MKNIAIIYHDADFDGKLSNEVCRFHLSKLHTGAAIHSYGWDYGRPVPDVSEIRVCDGQDNDGEPIFLFGWDAYDAIYIVDLSVDELMARPELRDKIVWIDHHKSAIEKWDGRTAPISGNPIPNFDGIRIDGVAACRLCWQWFVWDRLPKGVLPSKQDSVEPLTKALFVNRRVSEPNLLRLAGEYDIWDHRDPNAKVLQFGLRALSEGEFNQLLHEAFMTGGTGILSSALAFGEKIKSYCDRQNDEYSSAYAQTIRWEGLTFCALNIGQRGNSDLLRGGLKPEHDACFAWRWTGDKVLISLYHVEGKTHHDLSQIAVKYGGGGHKGACGFRLTLTELSTIISS